VPFDNAEYDTACVADPESFRQPLTELFGQPPELLPASLDEGFGRPDQRWSLKQQRRLRRLALKATAGVFLGRPSCLLPAMGGWTEAVAKALSLRHWGVPFDALVSVCGRATRWTGTGPSWPWDDLPSWAAPSSGPSSSPDTGWPTRSPPEPWGRQSRCRPP
jgi:hypothetical protein